MKSGKRCIQVGGTGAAIAVICCFTPLLVVIFGAIGLGMMTKYLDFILLPALFICLGLLAYGFRIRQKEVFLSKGEKGI